MKIIAIVVTLIASVISAFASEKAFSSPDPFFNRLQGDWTGEGMAFGAQARIQTKWEWALEGKFFRLSLKYETKGSDGSVQVFAGHAYYQAARQGAYEGQWFDSLGNQYPIKARLEGDALIALWGIPGKIEGKSVYRLTESDKGFEVTDALKQKDGSWKEFSRFKLHR